VAEDEAFHLLWMLERELHSDAPSHGDAQNVGVRNAERCEQPSSIVDHNFDRVRYIRLVGSPHASVIKRDHSIFMRKLTDDLFLVGKIRC